MSDGPPGGLISDVRFQNGIILIVKHILLFTALFLLAQPLVAQDKQQLSSEVDSTFHLPFEDAANLNRGEMLFKCLQYTAPYQGGYAGFILGKDGSAATARIVPFAVQDTRSGKLSIEQMEEVKRMIAVPFFQSPPARTEPRDGENYAAVVFFNGRDYARYDYSGPLPPEVQRVIDFVKTEIEKQEKLRYEKWLEDQKAGSETPPTPERYR